MRSISPNRLRLTCPAFARPFCRAFDNRLRGHACQQPYLILQLLESADTWSQPSNRFLHVRIRSTLEASRQWRTLEPGAATPQSIRSHNQHCSKVPLSLGSSLDILQRLGLTFLANPPQEEFIVGQRRNHGASLHRGSSPSAGIWIVGLPRTIPPTLTIFQSLQRRIPGTRLCRKFSATSAYSFCRFERITTPG